MTLASCRRTLRTIRSQTVPTIIRNAKAAVPSIGAFCAIRAASPIVMPAIATSVRATRKKGDSTIALLAFLDLRRPLDRGLHAETSIPPYWHISSASEDGESSLVEDWNETQQLPAGAGAEPLRAFNSPRLTVVLGEWFGSSPGRFHLGLRPVASSGT